MFIYTHYSFIYKVIIVISEDKKNRDPKWSDA